MTVCTYMVEMIQQNEYIYSKIIYLFTKHKYAFFYNMYIRRVTYAIAGLALIYFATQTKIALLWPFFDP